MNSYKKNNVVIVILVSLFLIVAAALVYFFYFLDYPEKEEDKKESIYIKITDENVINELENTINNNMLYLLLSYDKGIDNTNAIEESKKMELAIKSVIKDIEDPYIEGINIDLIEIYFKNTFKTTMYWDKDNVICECGENLYLYDKDNNKYIYNNEHLGHGMIEVLPYYSKVIDAKKKNDTYVITLSYVWNMYSEVYGYTKTGYVSFNDALSNTNTLFDIEVPEEITDDNIDRYAISEIENNYELYKDKLHKVTYVFEKNNDKFLLVNLKHER